mmetsp:Transcript_8941/g.19107  ORF Transcript_8941/g.19107 Transcript_8941/m.19107 type:complete len:439 (-) Transcript_8941:941-2257(-)|eukprot:CAMPEP_0202890276 /NCGR_PEP_ID=MMETSP1392-20130828/743_1 /ASSEMBLY_ACC=CAM_ASM_000868 /TAXON_ID=225041 /ORGANISM="Chlamydomonas chlamydogama, Strain SAG 11-48b" /LENGTH=438 /DNA_ID=CAMNT_0049573813 /DNA_START=163 /DNA_END=1479 /DNA_ORIENTATION=-
MRSFTTSHMQSRNVLTSQQQRATARKIPSSALPPSAASVQGAQDSSRSAFRMFGWLKGTHHKRRSDACEVEATQGGVTTTTVERVSDYSQDGYHEGNGDAPLGDNSVDILRLACSACYLPHPDKVHYGGEDAHFLSSVGGGAMGVADGVGGWQESGVNPAEYSRRLMHYACAYLEGSDLFEETAKKREPGNFVDPRGALHAAHMATKVPGSATACVMQLDRATRQLVAANLGDSGFMVIRHGHIIARSKPLQHYFDCPLQFGAFPEFVEATDTADMADLYNIQLAVGDVVVAGSDGLWDNVYDSEILELMPHSEEQVQQSADKLAALARVHASDNEFASPYTREALSQGLDLPWWEKLFGASIKNGRFHLKQLTGGKQDDITVLMAYVAADPVPPPPAPQAAAEEAPQPAVDTATAPGGPLVQVQPSAGGSGDASRSS